MNKKVLGLVVSLLFVAALATPMVAPVMAGKGQTRQSFQLSRKEFPFFELGDESHASPTSSAGMDYPIQKTYHGRGNLHTSPMVWDIMLKIGGDEEDSPTSITGGCDFDINWKTGTIIHRVTETLTFDSSGTIVLSIIEKIYNYGSPTMTSEGTLIGFGTGIFEDVKIVGTTSSEIVDWIDFGPGIGYVPVLEITHYGVIMGWPN